MYKWTRKDKSQNCYGPRMARSPEETSATCKTRKEYYNSLRSHVDRTSFVCRSGVRQWNMSEPGQAGNRAAINHPFLVSDSTPTDVFFITSEFALSLAAYRAHKGRVFAKELRTLLSTVLPGHQSRPSRCGTFGHQAEPDED